MKRYFFAAAVFLLPIAGSAQLGGVLKRLKNTAAATAEKKADGATSSVDKGIDKLFGKKSKKEGDKAMDETTATQQPSDEQINGQKVQPLAAPSPANALTAYSRFDFVQGEKMVYAEDFSKDAVGEFPLQWTTKSKGEIMTLDKYEGHWLRGYKKSGFTSMNKNELGDDYTIEFDMIYYFGAPQAIYVNPTVSIRVLNNYTVDYKKASGNVSDRDGEQSFELKIHPKDAEALAWLETYGVPGGFRSDHVSIPHYTNMYNQPVHYAIQVQKTRIRVWVNEKKVIDLPQAITLTKKMARVTFGMGDASYDQEQVGFYVSNIRMADGAPDTRHKLLETGKFSTSGILFNVNSDQLKPESAGIIREIAKVLTDNPTVRIKINGHTSSDGAAARNLELSKQRALAVKNFLANECKIEASRLETAGLGDTQPIVPNTTQEGRMQNRRVEFIKL